MATLSAVLPFWLDRRPGEALEIARVSEEHGLRGLWIGEMATFDAFALSGAIAARTQRLELTIGPLALGVRSPVALALGVSSIEQIGRRTARLALGASSPQIVDGWHGGQWKELPRRLQETVTALRPLLRGKRGEFEGRLVRSRGFKLQRPATDHVTVAAFGPKMLEQAVASADRIVLNLLSVSQIRWFRRRIDALAQERGIEAPTLAAWVPAGTTLDAETLAQVSCQLAVYLSPPGYGEMFTELGFGELVKRARGGEGRRSLAAAVPPALLEAIGLFGDARALERRWRELAEAGLDEIAVVPSTAADPGGDAILGTLAEIEEDKG